MGVEIELLAPRKRSRRDLALAIAARYGANVRRFFHPQIEPSKVQNTPLFENLTLGFRVEDDRGNVLAQCVDDLTLQDDLDRRCRPEPDWYRIVSDDARLLRLAMLHMDADAPLNEVLLPLARLFGTNVQEGEGGIMHVADQSGASIAIGAPLPGERERPCELVTPPIETDHLDRLEELLEPARSLGFLIPSEGAIHLHFDATPLCKASTLANLVRFLGIHTDALKKRVGTNPRCRRLGSWPAELFELVSSEGFAELEWAEARERLSRVGLTKYCDFNLRNFIHCVPGKHTFEVRILPVWPDARKIIEAASLFAAILRWARDDGGKLKPVPDDPDRFAAT
ncbi:MAG: amidoligase family protein [Pyrinomonadaceae bacterium]